MARRGLSTSEKLASGNPAVRREGKKEAAKQTSSQRSRTISKAKTIATKYSGTVDPSKVEGPSSAQIKSAGQTPRTAGEAVRMAREFEGTPAQQQEYLRVISETATRRQVATQPFVTRAQPSREPARPEAAATRIQPAIPPAMISARAAPLTRAEMARKQTLTYGTGAKGYLAERSEVLSKQKGFTPAVGSFAVGVGKFGYGVGKFGKDLVISPGKTVKETGKGLYTLAKDPTVAGYQFAEYYRKKPFEATGQVAGAALFSKGVEKVTAKAGTKITQKYGEVKLKPSKVVTKTRTVATAKGTEIRGTAMLKGRAERYIPVKIGKKTIKAFRKESDVAFKFKIKGTPKEFVGKGKGVVDTTRIKVKSAAPAYVRGGRTAEIYDVQTGKQFGKLLRGAKTKTQDITRIATVGKKQTVVRGQRVARTDSVFKIRPTGKKEVVIAPKEMIYAREAKKAGRFAIGEAKTYETFTTKTPPIRTIRLKGAELIAPIKGKEAFAKGFGRASAQTIARKTKLESLARSKLRGYLPKEARIAGVTGVGLETPGTLIVPPKTKPSARYVSGIGATAKDLAKGAVLLKPTAGIPALGILPSLRQISRTRQATRPIQRPATIQRPRQRQRETPRLRDITIPATDTQTRQAQVRAPRQLQPQRLQPVPAQAPGQELRTPGLPRGSFLRTPAPRAKVIPYRPLRRARLRQAASRFQTLLKQPKAYAPTLRARIFSIKAPKGIEKKKLTGLEERGIL